MQIKNNYGTFMILEKIFVYYFLVLLKNFMHFVAKNITKIKLENLFGKIFFKVLENLNIFSKKYLMRMYLCK